MADVTHRNVVTIDDTIVPPVISQEIKHIADAITQGIVPIAVSRGHPRDREDMDVIVRHPLTIDMAVIRTNRHEDRVAASNVEQVIIGLLIARKTKLSEAIR